MEIIRFGRTPSVTEKLIKILVNDAGDERVLVVHRADGAYTFQRQRKHTDGWSGLGPALGLYDSAETAENEARSRVPWLVPLFH
jgi:hypothetical protein